MNTNKKENKSYIFHLPGDLVRELRQIAAKRGDPFSVVVREALRDYLLAVANKG